jgi:hypothetical protein
MKRGTPDHPKVYDLCDRLKIKRPTAIGYLELLWHFTAIYAPEGDIGRYSDKRIEAAMDWSGASGRLIQALISSGWLDEKPVNSVSTTPQLVVNSVSTHAQLTLRSLVVHDWHEHADQAVRKRLQRSGKQFVTNTSQVTGQHPVTDGKTAAPKLDIVSLARARMPEPEPEPEPNTYIESSEGNRDFSSAEELVEAITPRKTKLLSVRPDDIEERWVTAEWAEELFSVHPSKKDKELGFQAAHAAAAILTPSGEWKSRKAYRGAGERLNSQDKRFRDMATDRHRAWCATEDWLWKGGARAPTLHEWFRSEGYLYDPPADTPKNGGSAMDRLFAGALAKGHGARA